MTGEVVDLKCKYLGPASFTVFAHLLTSYPITDGIGLSQHPKHERDKGCMENRWMDRHFISANIIKLLSKLWFSFQHQSGQPLLKLLVIEGAPAKAQRPAV